MLGHSHGWVSMPKSLNSILVFVIKNWLMFIRFVLENLNFSEDFYFSNWSCYDVSSQSACKQKCTLIPLQFKSDILNKTDHVMMSAANQLANKKVGMSRAPWTAFSTFGHRMIISSRKWIICPWNERGRYMALLCLTMSC